MFQNIKSFVCRYVSVDAGAPSEERPTTRLKVRRDGRRLQRNRSGVRGRVCRGSSQGCCL